MEDVSCFPSYLLGCGSPALNSSFFFVYFLSSHVLLATLHSSLFASYLTPITLFSSIISRDAEEDFGSHGCSADYSLEDGSLQLLGGTLRPEDGGRVSDSDEEGEQGAPAVGRFGMSGAERDSIAAASYATDMMGDSILKESVEGDVVDEVGESQDVIVHEVLSTGRSLRRQESKESKEREELAGAGDERSRVDGEDGQGRGIEQTLATMEGTLGGKENTPTPGGDSARPRESNEKEEENGEAGEKEAGRESGSVMAGAEEGEKEEVKEDEGNTLQLEPSGSLDDRPGSTLSRPYSRARTEASSVLFDKEGATPFNPMGLPPKEEIEDDIWHMVGIDPPSNPRAIAWRRKARNDLYPPTVVVSKLP